MNEYNIVLFDMDGTLTPSRQSIDQDMIDTLLTLSKKVKIGIVTGSGFDYVQEQCNSLLSNNSINKKNLAILPCNGTQRYYFGESTKAWRKVYSNNMKKQIGDDNFKKIVKTIFKLQQQLMDKYNELPLSGTFIQYRGSMLNWCPMGRDYNHEDRKAFIDIDKKSNLRKTLIKNLKKIFNKKNDNITFVLGGECSIDIYPKGWDKRYCLKQYLHYENVFFVGDRCKKGGNDYHLFKELDKKHTAFETKNPKDTIRIINDIIIPRLESNV